MTDAVHGSAVVSEGLRAVLDTPEVQRLRRLRQLGLSHLVYPSALHNRFSHSLGVVSSLGWMRFRIAISVRLTSFRAKTVP